jgi:hypothetical protein
MLGNVALDGVFGAVPLVGDAFDVLWRANRRNMRLLREWLERDEGGSRTTWQIAAGGSRCAQGRPNRKRLGTNPLLTAKDLLARFTNLQPYDFERLQAADHALGGLGGDSEAHQLRQLIGREAVREHNCLGAAFATAASEQSKRSALIGLGAATAGREGQQS